MLRLSELNLTPFKSVAVTRAGAHVLLTRAGESESDELSWRWVVKSNGRVGDNFWTNDIGEYDPGEEENFDIIKILKPWTPRAGDIARAYGFAEKILPSASRAQRSREFVGAEVKVLGLYNDLNELFEVERLSTRYKIHRSNLRFLRRPDAARP